MLDLPLESRLQCTPFVWKRSKQKVPADTSRKRRVHYTEIQFWNLRIGNGPCCSARANCLDLTVIESDLGLHFIGIEKSPRLPRRAWPRSRPIGMT